LKNKIKYSTMPKKLSELPQVPTIASSNDMLIGVRYNGDGTYTDYKYSLNDLPSIIGPEGPQGPAGSVGPQGAQGIEGPQGPAGLAGPVGPAGLTWKSAWVSGTSYNQDDAVGYGGASWFCISATSGTDAPDIDTIHWALLAAQGATGATGATGAQGPIGPAGTNGINGKSAPPHTILTYGLSNAINRITINTAGSGYVIGDNIIIVGGTIKAQYAVASINGTGGITGLTLINGGGKGYSTGTNIATISLFPSVGNGATINITGLSSFSPASDTSMTDSFYKWPIISILKGSNVYLLGKDYTQDLYGTYGTITALGGSGLLFGPGDIILANTY
jgi:hypothetical protein